MEAIFPIEIGMPTLRIKLPEKANIKAIAKDLDMVNELREAEAVHIASYQKRATRSYNRHVKQRTFHAGDLVIRKVFENMADPTAKKFHPN